MTISGAMALGSLLRLGKPVVTTEDVALRLGLTVSAATRALGRLEAAGLIVHLRRGLWSLDPKIDPLLLPEYLTAPYPAYVSLQSALLLHGMIRQVPQVIYAASLAPTKRVKTRVGEYSIHRLAPSFYGGFASAAGGVRLATPEKALLDVLYLGPGRSRLFAALPEVELPAGFDEGAARQWVKRITEGPRRRAVQQRLEKLLKPLRHRPR
jgi:predicted transcriptional regulator of viral defense system